MLIPQGVNQWFVAIVGLILVLLRGWGTIKPRAWVETTERRFVESIKLRFIGGIFLAAAIAVSYFGKIEVTLIGGLFFFSVLILGILGFFLAVLQNHLRHMIIASAESSDLKLRIVSIVVVLIGLVMAASFWLVTLLPAE
jgi:uncharacterized protein YjeT (DUF2065 family)